MGMLARPLSWSEGDRPELERLSRSQATPRRLVVRARIVLACLYGEPRSPSPRGSARVPTRLGSGGIAFPGLA